MLRRWIVVVASVAAWLLAGCPNEMGALNNGGNNNPPEDPYWCCDPDDPTGCVCEGYWHCTEGFDSSKHCVQQNPDLPDGGEGGPWDCYYNGDLIVCEGSTSEHPDAGQDGVWDCVENGDAIQCTREQDDDDIPDGGGGSGWDCEYADGADARVCDQPGDGSPDDGGWNCETYADGTTVCRNDNPEQPDDGNWDCYRVDGVDYCVGDSLPDGGDDGAWDCQENGEMVQCENGGGQVPDGGGGGEWDCAWGEGFIECESGDDGVGEPGESCECVVGAQRYCDEPTFCNWGTQECEERNGERRWSRCTETAILSGCQPGGADAQDYEWHYAGGFWDGQVFDPNNDGILVMPPDNWYNPAAEDCALRKGFCVQDMWDLDNDMDNQESVGDCEDIQVCE